MICVCGNRTDIKDMMHNDFKLCICPKCKRAFVFDITKDLNQQLRLQVDYYKASNSTQIKYFTLNAEFDIIKEYYK